MSSYKNLFLFGSVLFFLLPATAAECAPDLAINSCTDQVKLVMNPTGTLLAQGRIDDVWAAPFLPPSRPVGKMLPESASFSEEGSTMRWLYSTVAEKRIFTMYTGPQRGRPAELRITVRLSLL
jgi:hypothetical protein